MQRQIFPTRLGTLLRSYVAGDAPAGFECNASRRVLGAPARPGLKPIPPLRGWILRNRFTMPTQNRFSHTPFSPRGICVSDLFSKLFRRQARSLARPKRRFLVG